MFIGAIGQNLSFSKILLKNELVYLDPDKH